MPKIVELGNIGSNYASQAKLNSNFAKIEAALKNTLSRDGSSPNEMLDDFNMNHFRIENVGNAFSPTDAVNLKQVTDLISAIVIPPSSGGGGGSGTGTGVTDGNKGDISVSGNGAVWSLDNTIKVTLRDRSTHTGEQPINSITGLQTALNSKLADSHAGSGGTAHALATPVLAGFMSSVDKTKLDAIAPGATVNSTDAALRTRSTHTGTQPASTISDLVETVQDVVGSMLLAGSNISLNYNDTAGTLTITAAGGSGSSTGTGWFVSGIGTGAVQNIVLPEVATLTDILVFVDGIQQDPTADFTVSDVTLTITAPSGAEISVLRTAGAPGAAGRTILSGNGAPVAGTGVNGDFYIDTSTYNIYGPKAGGVWPSGVSLVGPAGGSGGVADGDKGHIVVSASGAIWNFDSSVVTPAALTLLDDVDVGTMRTTLGLGTLATKNGVGDAEWTGADLSITNGGTGASSASVARDNLGLKTGATVAIHVGTTAPASPSEGDLWVDTN